MKRILLLSVFVTSLGAYASGPAGCGLGAVLFEGKSGLFWNLLAATSNGISGNQTFGMSTGTLGCDADEKIASSAINFIEANKVALANDVARGEGETIASLGKIYNCGNVEALGSSLQNNYDAVFSSMEASSIHSSISNVIIENKACI